MNANDLTARIMEAISKRYRNDVLVWRNNTGKAVGWGRVQDAIACIRCGDVSGAFRHLSRPVSFGLVGSADILLVSAPNGRFGGIEVKAGNDRQSPIQRAFELRVKAVGGFYIIARDVDKCITELEGVL